MEKAGLKASLEMGGVWFSSCHHLTVSSSGEEASPKNPYSHHSLIKTVITAHWVGVVYKTAWAVRTEISTPTNFRTLNMYQISTLLLQ